ncbi:MAG TPA: hypothetical protein PK236_01420 [Verrucomicrobiota bacterium]|nr:hypothetical protein [Verrucomicrobiota bacterium]
MAFIGALLTCGKHEDKPAKGGVHFAAQEWHHIISISNWFWGRVGKDWGHREFPVVKAKMLVAGLMRKKNNCVQNLSFSRPAQPLF